MDRKLVDSAANFGSNVGMALQLMDDWLDFVASAEQVGSVGWFQQGSMLRSLLSAIFADFRQKIALFLML
jgi:geranylgeranyl pyrophosphate synthase